jgi:hypothetical protein
MMMAKYRMPMPKQLRQYYSNKSLHMLPCNLYKELPVTVVGPTQEIVVTIMEMELIAIMLHQTRVRPHKNAPRGVALLCQHD